MADDAKDTKGKVAGMRSSRSIPNSIDGKESSLKDFTSESPLYQVIFPLTCRFSLRIGEYNGGKRPLLQMIRSYKNFEGADRSMASEGLGEGLAWTCRKNPILALKHYLNFNNLQP